MFHLRKGEGTSVFLFPERMQESFHDGRESIKGFFGIEPGIEDIKRIKTLLYLKADEAALKFIAEKHFIPRFLLSALVFTALYFFLSFVIRDPLPIVDELVGSLVGSGLFYVSLRKKKQESAEAFRTKELYQKKVDGIVFVPASFVFDIEEIYLRARTRRYEFLREAVADLQKISAAIETKGDREEISVLDSLRDSLHHPLGSQFVKRFRRRFGDGKGETIRWEELESFCRVYRQDSLIAFLLFL